MLHNQSSFCLELIAIIVGQALVRYVNDGVTLGSVNLPEVSLRSLASDEPDHARVYTHQDS